MPKLRGKAQNVVEYGLIIVTIVLVVLLGVMSFGHLIEPWFRWPGWAYHHRRNVTGALSSWSLTVFAKRKLRPALPREER